MFKKVLSIVISVGLMTAAFTGCSSTSKPTNSGSGKTSEIDYPKKPISLYCGFSAGGSSDLMVRIVAAKMADRLGQPVTVINKAGGSGWVLWNEAIKSMAGDGYNLVLINTPNYSTGAYDTANKREYKYDALDLLMNQVTDSNVIAIRKDETRFTDFKSFVEYAKNNKVLSSASGTGISSDDSTILDAMNKFLGTKITVIQTAGAKDNETMFISKNTDVLVGNVADVLTGVKNGEFKVIVTFAEKRSKLLPDVPTAIELGFSKDLVGASSRGYAIPKGADTKVREKLANALEATINDPEVVKKLEEMGAETDFLKGQDYIKLMEDSITRSKKIYDIK